MDAAAAYVEAADALPGLKEVCLDRRPFVDRYYTKKYFASTTGSTTSEASTTGSTTSVAEEGDYMLLVHSNKLSVLTLAPSHPIIKQNLTVTSINFQISKNVNRLENVAKGKGKKGAQFLQPSAPICTIETSCGRSFVVRAGIVAKLLEVNDRIVLEPELLKKAGTGYLAIFSCRAADFEKQMKSLMSEEEYLDTLKNRSQLL